MLSAAELKQALAKEGTTMTDDEATAIEKTLDETNEGKFTYRDFHNMMKGVEDVQSGQPKINEHVAQGRKGKKGRRR